MTPRDFRLGNKNERGKIGLGSERINIITKQTTQFFIYSLSSIRWHISFLQFKDVKNSIPWDPAMHYVLGFKIHIYM